MSGGDEDGYLRVWGYAASLYCDIYWSDKMGNACLVLMDRLLNTYAPSTAYIDCTFLIMRQCLLRSNFNSDLAQSEVVVLFIDAVGILAERERQCLGSRLPDIRAIQLWSDRLVEWWKRGKHANSVKHLIVALQET